MLIKMRESKGFTLVELMIVVAIIGILAAVAVPFYQKYVQKARLTSLVFPTMHSVETNIGAYFSTRNYFPQSGSVDVFTSDSSTKYVIVDSAGTNLSFLSFQINSPGTTSPLFHLTGKTITAKAQLDDASQKILGWELGGSLATQLGLK